MTVCLEKAHCHPAYPLRWAASVVQEIIGLAITVAYAASFAGLS
jgi:hypothetical protein